MKLNPSHPTLTKKKTIHPKIIKNPNNKLFKLISNNQKIKKNFTIVQKKNKTKFPIYILTLQKRTTYPSYYIH